MVLFKAYHMFLPVVRHIYILDILSYTCSIGFCLFCTGPEDDIGDIYSCSAKLV